MAKNIAVVTISDTCSKDPEKDTSGPVLAELLQQEFPLANIVTKIVPDNQWLIQGALMDFSIHKSADIILTIGGTGCSPKANTPEATKSVIQKETPGITTALTIANLQRTPMAMLSRAVAGIYNKTLIINFPGSTKAVIECFAIVRPVLSHAVSALKDQEAEVTTVHDSMQHVCPPKALSSKVDVTTDALRDRESPYPMLEIEEAWKIVEEVMGQWKGQEEVEVVPIEESLGRVVADQVRSKETMPPFPASVKDGYACISADGAGVRRVRSALTAGDAPAAAAPLASGECARINTGAALPPGADCVVQVIRRVRSAVTAGDAPAAPLARGECARINTGAALPPGADCVVQVEDTKLVSGSEDGRTEFEVEILVAPKPNQDIRPIAFVKPKDAILVNYREIMDAFAVGVLAGAGYQTVGVWTVPKFPEVALLSIGNELQEPSEEKLRPGHIRDPNRTMLRVLLKEHGFSSIDCGIAREDPDQLVTAISSALKQADVLVCTGGVSMHERDLLKLVLVNDFGATLHFGRVRMKPGEPTTFATCQLDGRTKYIFALPGNPVSAYICCLLFVMRGLRQCAGLCPEWQTVAATLMHNTKLDQTPAYARAKLIQGGVGRWNATLVGSKGYEWCSLFGADVLVALPAATAWRQSMPAGTEVTALVVAKLDR